MILVVGDTRRLYYRLKKAGGVFSGLDTATITWKLRKPDASVVTETMTLESAATGRVYVDPVDALDASHFTAEGRYDAEVVVQRAGQEPEYPERPQVIFVRSEYEIAGEV